MTKSKIWWIHDQKVMHKYRFEYKHEQEIGWVINEFERKFGKVTDMVIIRTDEEENENLSCC